MRRLLAAIALDSQDRCVSRAMNITKILLETPDFIPSLTIERDDDLARIYHEENFTLLAGNLSRETTVLAYLQDGNLEAPAIVSDCLDFSAVTPKAAQKALVDYLGEEAEELPLEDCLDTLKETIELDLSFHEIACEELAQPLLESVAGLAMAYEVVSSSGYSQGDYALVLVHRQGYEALMEEPFWDSQERLSDYFDNLLWNQPLYLSLELGECEDEVLYPADPYKYDEGEILELCKAAGATPTQLERIGESLPDYV